MKKMKKVLALAACAVLLVTASVMGTLAYLTSQDTVENTFTVGNVQINLFESIVNEMGEKTGGRTEDGNKYHLLPGHTYSKDPTVHILEGSESSYVRMLVKVKNYSNLKAAMPESKYPTYYVNGDFLLQYLVEGWSDSTWISTNKIDVVDDVATYEFRYHEAVAGPEDDNDAETKLERALTPLFTSIKVPETVNNTELQNLKNVSITIEAHAIQADGFEDKDGKTAEGLAWEAFDR